jgi:hypothetical protein
LAPASISGDLDSFRIDGAAVRYSVFVPRLYNLCRSFGMEHGKIMPSRAFCADENQGFPIILITKHVGTFPFDHGRAGGIVATDRHGPHAGHGEDVVIIQASHVGYDPETGEFGRYRRLQTENHATTATCGKVAAVLSWYLDEYRFAAARIVLERHDDQHAITIDNQLLQAHRAEGLVLNLDRLVRVGEDGEIRPVQSRSTSKTFLASPALVDRMGEGGWPVGSAKPIGARLDPALFRFTRSMPEDLEGSGRLESNLMSEMPSIVTSRFPLLDAARINTQVEFNRTFRTIVKEHGYHDKRVVCISGLNIDISPQPGQMFPLTKFVPWAAYVQERGGAQRTIEQPELISMLNAQSEKNSDEVHLEEEIGKMTQVDEVQLKGP